MAIANPMMNPRLVEGVKTVVFDNDGVLIQSFEANMHYYGTIKEQLGLPPMNEDEKVFVHTHTHNEAIRYIVPEDKLEAAWEACGGFDSASLNEYLSRSDGVREFLCFLRDAGFKLAVNTSRGESMSMILSMMELEGFFHPVVTSCDVCVPKPHPEGLFSIIRAHGVQPNEVAYIGDSHVDEQAARAAGVRFWAYDNPSLSAEVHIESFWDIKAVMQRCYKDHSPLF